MGDLNPFDSGSKAYDYSMLMPGTGAETSWILGLGDSGYSPQHSVGKPDPQITGEATKAQTEAARSMEKIAGELWGAGSDIRPALQQAYGELLSNNMSGENSPLYQALSPAAGSQFDVAMRNVLESGGGEGSQQRVSEGRAETLSDLMARANADDYQKLFAVAFGEPGTALQGYQGAGNIWGNIGMQDAMRQQMYGDTAYGLGAGAGALYGMRGGGGMYGSTPQLNGPTIGTDAWGNAVILA